MQKELEVFQIDGDYNLKPYEKVVLEFRREPSPHHIRFHLVMQWSNRRLGTVSTKRRGEVRGGGRKPWPQKHTGRARHGSIRSPIWRKGGVVFGPKPRSWTIKMNKKERRLALYSLLYTKIDDFVVINEYSFNTFKTKNFSKLFNNVANMFKDVKKLLVLYAEKDESVINLIKGARNIENVKIIKAQNINVEDFLRADKIVADKKSLMVLKNLFIDTVKEEREYVTT